MQTIGDSCIHYITIKFGSFLPKRNTNHHEQGCKEKWGWQACKGNTRHEHQHKYRTRI